MASDVFREDEDLSLLRESVKRFAQEAIAPVAKELDAREEFSYELTQKMGELGLFGILVSRNYGGSDLGYLSFIVAIEELARVDSSQAATLSAGSSLGIGPILNYGTEEQKQRYLPQLCSGKGLWGFGLTEADAGSDAQAIKTSAEFDKQSNEWVINGAKLWITNSSTEITKGITIQARTACRDDGRPEFTAFLVEADAKGLVRHTVKDKMMWRASNTGELYLDKVRVPQANVLGEVGQGFKIMMQTLDRGRLSLAAMGLGLAKGALELSLNYSKERVAFAKPLHAHQAVAFKLAEMATRIEAAEAMLYKTCRLKEAEQPFETLAAMSKLYCSELAEFCAREGQQIFGGYGLMKEYPIERHYRDASLLRIGEGTSEIQKIVISRALGCR